MSRRQISTLLAVALLLAAYALSARHLFRPSEKNAPRVTLRFAHWQLEAGMREAFDQVAQRYMQLHPDVRVEQLAVPGTVYKQWLSTQLAGGTVPDLVSFNSTDPTLMAQLPRHFVAISRWLEEPNPYNAGTRLAGVPWRLTFIDGGRNRSTYLDQYRNYYAVGLSTQSMRMFYNRDLLREITGSDTPPADFQAWLALCQRVRAHRPGLQAVAGSREQLNWLLPTFLNQATMRWMMRSDHALRYSATATDFFTDYLRGRWDLRSPEVQKSLRIARAFGGEMPPGFLQLDRDSATQAFMRGEALFIPSGTWDYPTMRAQASFAIGAFRVPLPADDDREYGGDALQPVSDGSLSTAMPFYLAKQSRHQAEAIDFLRFVTSIEGNRLFSHASHWMPSVEGVEIDAELKPFARILDGYMTLDGYNAPALIGGPGADTTRLFETNLSLLYAPNGGVEALTAAIESRYRATVRSDLTRVLSTQRENLRRRDTALGALLFLGPPEQAEAARQLSGQHLVETQACLLADTLAQTR
ncbi:MAG: extracellular solute-binding protein [Verrucomicrobia bacterium]|nr:extracellular solute-binding protein [Verrucomicrobiota bacterium]